jgi:hypothetical protein
MRKQRAFATLTEHEIDQIAEWLRSNTYEVVRDRIAKPRPEGFALQLKSTHPLETLWERKNTVDKINTKLESGQKLTLAEFESILGGAGVPPAVEDVPSETSSSVQDEKCEMHNVHLDSRSEQPNFGTKFEAGSGTPCSMKENPRIIQIHNAILETAYDRILHDDNTPFQLLALQKLADFPARAAFRARKEERDIETREHKTHMDLHRKQMAEHRKQIATERLTLAKQSFELRAKQFASGPAENPKSEIRNPQFALWTPDDIIHNQPKVEAAIQADPFLSQIGLPPDNPPTPHLAPTPPDSAPSAVNHPEPLGSLQNPQSEIRLPQSFEPLESRVNKYTLARHHEALIGKDPSKVGRAAAFDFHSTMEHCPCGNHLPCLDHGDFPRRFFEVMPDDADYFQLLEKKKLPFTPIHQLLALDQSQSEGANEN